MRILYKFLKKFSQNFSKVFVGLFFAECFSLNRNSGDAFGISPPQISKANFAHDYHIWHLFLQNLPFICLKIGTSVLKVF